MNGFREFLEDVDHLDAQRQMLGWSNPDPLDAAFRPELVDQYLQTVVGRLRDRILAICSECLSQNGIAYVSYNTYPGGHIRDMVREMMLFHVRGASDVGQKLRKDARC